MIDREQIIRMAEECGIPEFENNESQADNIIRFAAFVSKQERWRGFNEGYKQAIRGVVDLLMIQHEAAKEQHNYWHVAANLIQAEYGCHHDD